MTSVALQDERDSLENFHPDIAGHWFSVLEIGPLIALV